MGTVWLLYASCNSGRVPRYLCQIFDLKPLKEEREKILKELDRVGLNGTFVSHKLIRRKTRGQLAQSNAKRGTKKSRRRV